jgi:penicillin-binding protein 1A
MAFEEYYRIVRESWWPRIRRRLSSWQPKGPEKPRWKKIAAWTLGSGLGLLVVFVILVRVGVFGKLPSRTQLKQIQHATASGVYATGGELLGKYYIENRTNVSYEDLPKHLVDALVATEDARFYAHAGVDWRSMGRVFFKSVLLMDRSSGGGSTITQQLAKNLYPREDWWLLSLPVSKVKEMLIARRLEDVYESKEAILTLYLNTVPFGESVFGIGAAAQRFFNTPPRELSPEAAATLIGMLKATTYYNPRNHPDRAIARRKVVLEQMVKYEYVSSARADSLAQLPLGLDYVNVTENDGLAPYFRQEVGAYLKRWLKDYNEAKGTHYNLFTDGLKVYTTLDATMQRYAETAVSQHMQALQATFDQHWSKRQLWQPDDAGLRRSMQQSRRYQSLKAEGKSEEEIMAVFNQPIKTRIWTWEGYEEREMSPMDSLIHANSFLHAGLMAMDPKTGYIRAWVGGINYRQFKYDHVTAHRQVGSTFKPIIYASALANGIDPCEYIPNQKVSYASYKNWAPGNADGKYEGYYSLKGGLVNSVNTVSAAVIMKVGVEQAAQFAERFGFTSKLPHDPSLVLGTADLSVQEMVGAYSTFANGGTRSRPVFISRIEDSEGKVLGEWPVQPEQQQVMDETTNAMMVNMMQAVVDSGTASRLRYRYGLRTAIAGKTGTTQNQTDGWFMGVTPGLVVGVWVGGDDRQVRFRSLSLGQGANTALPIFGLFMQQVYRDGQYQRLRRATFPQGGLSALQDMDCPMYSELGIDPNQSDLMILLAKLKREAEERRENRQDRRENRQEKRRDRWENFFNQDRKDNR